jgi:hypothetical protein
MPTRSGTSGPLNSALALSAEFTRAIAGAVGVGHEPVVGDAPAASPSISLVHVAVGRRGGVREIAQPRRADVDRQQTRCDVDALPHYGA